MGQGANEFYQNPQQQLQDPQRGDRFATPFSPSHYGQQAQPSPQQQYEQQQPPMPHMVSPSHQTPTPPRSNSSQGMEQVSPYHPSQDPPKPQVDYTGGVEVPPSPGQQRQIVSPHYQQQSQQQQQPLQYPPQPITPHTPSSHGGATPQPPLTPQDMQQLSGPSTPVGGGGEITSPNHYHQYEQQQAYPQGQGHVYPPQHQGGFPQQRPVSLEPQPQHSFMSTSPVPPGGSKQAPSGDQFIEEPDPSQSTSFVIKCNFCTNLSKTKSDFWRHLSERHYKTELSKELPSSPPFRCPLESCTYEAKDNSLSPLIKHYGIVHKQVQRFLSNKVGKYVPAELKPPSAKSQKKAEKQLQYPPLGQELPNGVLPQGAAAVQVAQQQQQQPGYPPAQYMQHSEPQTHQQQQPMTMSNQALNVKCPFCDLMFAAKYAFHQHLCD